MSRDKTQPVPPTRRDALLVADGHAGFLPKSRLGGSALAELVG